jgi:phosphopantothenoylcysteine decarboxylase/phosphopantothenate--cysteine ligase
MIEKRILLIVTGGIAAYKSLELVRLLKRQGIAVRAVMTKSAAEFVTPLSMAVMTEDQVYGHMFDLKEESEIGHIRQYHRKNGGRNCRRPRDHDPAGH